MSKIKNTNFKFKKSLIQKLYVIYDFNKFYKCKNKKVIGRKNKLLYLNFSI